MDTLVSLQIVQPESHPNAFNQGPGTSGSKESLSIYGLFHHLARTSQGRARLRQFFLRPSLNSKEITARHDFVAIFVRADNMFIAQRLSKSMGRIKNMRNTMTMLHKGVNSGSGSPGSFKSGVWASLLEFCYHSIDVADTLREVSGAEGLLLIHRAAEVLDRFNLQRLGKMVFDVVDLEASDEQHRTVVKRGVNDNLDRVKDVYDGMEDMLSRTAREISNTLPLGVEVTLNVIYFPQLGFHITVPIDETTNQPTYDGGSEAWERMFTTKNQIYFKDARMRAMDEELGDLWAMICDLEIEIAHELAQNMLQDEKLLVAASDLCGELDCLLALAHGASQYKLTRPHMVEENIINIKGGRHLLQEMTVPSYVPNDTLLVGGKGHDQSMTPETNPTSPESASASSSGPSMILLTGPNYSGKSVYQKAVALAVYMAHIGSFVPCTAATIGPTDALLTRITTRETVSKPQSAFMIDMQQIAMALNTCTRHSLLIIDEFGKGTDSCDGAGLAAGVFHHLLSLGVHCPKVLAATHFHEIFEHSGGHLFDHRPSLALAHMEVRVDKKEKRKAGDHGSEVTYLYNLRPGRSTLSYGTQCAALNGIPSQVVARAVELADLAAKGEDLVAICSAMSAAEMEDLEDAEMTARAFLERDIEGEASMEEVMSVLSGVLYGSSTDAGS